MTDTDLQATPFTRLPLAPGLLQGIEDAGFSSCTPIQAKTLPVILAGTDVAGQAQTGTGKTAAFLLGAMNHLLNHPPPAEHKAGQPRVVILAPTRELAIQIHKDAELLGAHTGLRMGVVYGGAGYEEQRKMLEDGLDILIGTPGRFIDYFKQRVFGLNSVQVLILDEADRMFDLGFIKDIRYLLRRMPPPERRLNMLFSATLSFRVTELAYEHMNNPQLLAVEPDKRTVDKIRQVIYYPGNREKIPLLLGLLKRIDPKRTLIFANTKAAAERVWRYLEGNDLKAAVLSGDVPQKKRLHLLAEFQRGELPILVATDVAARGLHIPEVSHVFNFDLPQDREDYVHRIGRTARAGASGDAVSFACEEYAFSLAEIEEYIGHKIPTEAVSEDLLVAPKPPVSSPARPGRRQAPRGAKSGSRRGRGRRSAG